MPRKKSLADRAARARESVMRRARQHLAQRHPGDRKEIIDGDWDTGSGMLEVLSDMRLVGEA